MAVKQFAHFPNPSRVPANTDEGQTDRDSSQELIEFLETTISSYFQSLGLTYSEATPLVQPTLDMAASHMDVASISAENIHAWIQQLSTVAVKAFLNSEFCYYLLLEKFRKNRRYRQDAEDLIQNTLITALHKCQRGKVADRSIKGWLFTIATCTEIEHHRKESHQPQTGLCFRTWCQSLDGQTNVGAYPGSSNSQHNSGKFVLVDEKIDPNPGPSELADVCLKWELLTLRLHRKVIEAIRLLAEGWSQLEVAKKVGVKDRTIRRWLEKTESTVKSVFAS